MGAARARAHAPGIGSARTSAGRWTRSPSTSASRLELPGGSLRVTKTSLLAHSSMGSPVALGRACLQVSGRGAARRVLATPRPASWPRPASRARQSELHLLRPQVGPRAPGGSALPSPTFVGGSGMAELRYRRSGARGRLPGRPPDGSAGAWPRPSLRTHGAGTRGGGAVGSRRDRKLWAPLRRSLAFTKALLRHGRRAPATPICICARACAGGTSRGGRWASVADGRRRLL